MSLGAVCTSSRGTDNYSFTHKFYEIFASRNVTGSAADETPPTLLSSVND